MNAPLRRGACPGLSAPMPTGDGLLVRMLPIGTVPLTAFGKLCAAALEHGNGIVEITARGSIQVRGLNAASAPRFAAAVAALGIAAQDGVPVLTNALTGLDREEIFDAGALAADLRGALARGGLGARLAPKISVAVDGGGALNLDAVSADVRLRAQSINGGVALGVSVGGDGASATRLGVVAPANAVEAVFRLLAVIAERGRDARARDIVATEGIEPFRSAMGESGDPTLDSRLRGNERREAIGLHTLRDGSLACGVGLPFGHADAASLRELANAAGAAGSSGMRAANARVLIAIAVAPGKAQAFVAAAERLGFIVRADDPRRKVVACAGAPVCASAHIAARAMAPGIAAAAAEMLDGARTIHLSGCAKGCAHPAPAALTVVGTSEGCALIARGTARNTPFAVVAADQLPTALADALREHRHV